MKIDETVINARINKIQEYLKILKELKLENREKFLTDYRIHGLAERYLHLTIECVLDIGNHLISRLEYEKPETYQEIILILGKYSIIPKEFSEKIAKMAGFRNILIHNYLEINGKLVFEHLQSSLSDFEEFNKYIVEYIKKLK